MRERFFDSRYVSGVEHTGTGLIGRTTLSVSLLVVLLSLSFMPSGAAGMPGPVAASGFSGPMQTGPMLHTPSPACTTSTTDNTHDPGCLTSKPTTSAHPAESGAVVATIPVGCGPWGDAYDSQKGEIFITNSCGSSVTVISAATESVVATIALPGGSNPEGDAYDSRNGYIYTANTGGGTVSVISDATNTVVKTITVPNPVYPWGIAYDSRNGYIYAANDGGGDDVWVISGISVIKTIGVGSSPDGVTYDGENGNVYTANSGSQTLTVISGATNTVVGTVSQSSNWYPYWVAYGAKSGNVYVASSGTRDIYVISGYTNALVAAIPVPSANIEMSYDSGNNDAYATPCGGNQVYVVNGSSNTYLTSITVGNNPCGVVYDTTNGNLYVTNDGSNTVSVVSTSNPQVTVPAASKPSVDLSQSVTFSTTSLGGVPPYTYTWYGLPTGCPSVSATSITCTPTGAGSFTVSVTIKDSTGYTTSSGILPFNVYTDPQVAGPIASQKSVDANQTLTFNASAKGGTGNYTSFVWTESSTNLGCTLTSAQSIVCTPVKNGTYTTSVVVTDSNGCSSGTPGGCTAAPNSSAVLAVYADPTVGPPTISPGVVDAYQWVNLTSSTPVGGLPPYNFTWNGLPSNCASSGTLKDVCVPQSGGTFNVSVTVTDSNGYSITSPRVKLLVNNSLSLVLSASARTLDIGQNVTFTATGSYGSLPYTYTWAYASGMGCTPSKSPTLRCAPTQQGYSTIGVTLTDATGKNVSNILVETVNTHPTITLQGVNSTDLKQTLKFTTVEYGGTSPETYQWSAAPALGCTTSAGGTKETCTPTAIGIYGLSVTMQDAVGVVDTSTLSVTVNSPPSVILTGPTVTDVNQSFTLTTLVHNGTAPYNYIWSTGKGFTCAASNNTNMFCQPMNPGRYQVGVRLIDSAGLSSVSNLTVQVNTDPRAILLGKNATMEQSTWLLNAKVVGGTGPYTYSWAFPAAMGCASTNTALLNCTPALAGNYTVSVSIVDAVGVSSTTSLLVHVTTPPLPVSQPSELTWWIPSLIAILLVVVFFILTARRLRKSHSEKKAEEEGSAAPVASAPAATPSEPVSDAPAVVMAEPVIPVSEPEPAYVAPEPEYVATEPYAQGPQDYVGASDMPMPEEPYHPPAADLPGCPECGSPVVPGEQCQVCGSPTGLPPFPEEPQPTSDEMALRDYLDNYHARPPAPSPESTYSATENQEKGIQTCPKCGFPLPGPGAPCSICSLEGQTKKP